MLPCWMNPITNASLSNPRSNVAVVPIDSDTILVIGGISGGQGVAGAKAYSITAVEKGRATPSHKEQLLFLQKTLSVVSSKTITNNWLHCCML